MNESIHVAVTRRIKPGCEAEFQRALQEFFKNSFSHGGVQGASMIVPPPGSTSPEFGVLRTFVNEEERDAFYRSPMFKAWEEQIKPLTEGEPIRRQLTGLEAWFRSSNNQPPPLWKMAFITWIAVWPISMAVPALLTPLIGARVSNVFFAGAVAAGIVIVLTWVAMPIFVKAARPWLQTTIQKN
jgi:uncharacterized protein